MKTITLTKNKSTVVDDEDYDSLIKNSWNAKKNRSGNWYATRQVYRRNGFRDYRSRFTSMHVEILGEKSGFVVDHINGDSLDNRRQNLRHVTRGQNGINRINKRPGLPTGIYKKREKWAAAIRVRNKLLWLGTFRSIEEASEIRKKAEMEHFGVTSRFERSA